MVSTARKAYPDATTLIALASEMATSIKGIIESFGLYASAPVNKPISAQVRRVGATAAILSLRAVMLLAEEIAELASRVEKGAVPNDTQSQDALRSALSALHRYLTNAAAGKIGAGLVFHNAYADVTALMSDRRQLSRAELFLPVTPVYTPNSPTFNEGKFIAEVARYQDEYHQALLRYVASKNPETINDMRTSLVTMEAKNPPSNFRVLFSLAIGFFDVAIRNHGKISQAEEELLNRIDEELAGIVGGDTELDEGTVSWFLHALSGAPQFSARIRSFQDAYELKRLAEDDVSGVISEQTLLNAEKALENARKTWEAAMVTHGDIQAAKNTSFALLAVTNAIGDYPLRTMAMAFGSLADGVATQAVPVNQEIAVFGASVLLAIGNRIESIQNDPKGGRAVADFHRDRVRSVLSGNSPSAHSDASPTMDAHAQAILDEVINNVSATEQIVDQCLRDGVKEVKVNEALKLISMVRSALLLLNLEDGATLADHVQSHVRNHMSALVSGSAAEEGSVLMAESVMQLGRYIRLVLVDPPQATAALNKGLQLFATTEESSDEVPSTVLAEDLPYDACTDEELGPFFFEEAKEVIAQTIRTGLEKLRMDLKDEGALKEIRRGFHTLKGSARMVELNNLGMVGQYAEYTLNVCLENRDVKPTPDMIQWLDSLCEEFVQAIGMLEGGHRAQVNVPAAEAVHKRFMESYVFTLDTSVATTSAPLVVELDNVELAELDGGADVHIPETQPVILPMSEASEVELIEAGAETSDNVLADIVQAEGGDASQDEPTVVEAIQDTIPQGEHIDLPVVNEASDSADLPPLPESVLQDEPTEAAEPADELPALPESVVSSTVPVAQEEPAAESADVAIGVDDLPPMPESVATSVQTASDSTREVQVGDVTIPGVLYDAFVAEARNFYNELDVIVRDMINGKRQFMEFETMRLAHSLAGMGRTTGLSAITELASEIEAWASIMQDQKVTVDSDQQSTLRDALEALEAMILGVEDLLEPVTDEDLISQLKKLVSDAEHVLAHGRVQSEMTESDLVSLEEGGEVSDNGVSVIVAHTEEVVLDSSTHIAALDLAATQTVEDQAQTTFPATLPDLSRVVEVETTQPLANQEDEQVHIIGDTIDSAQTEESIVNAVAAEVSTSQMQDLVDEQSQNPAQDIELAHTPVEEADEALVDLTVTASESLEQTLIVDALPQDVAETVPPVPELPVIEESAVNETTPPVVEVATITVDESAEPFSEVPEVPPTIIESAFSQDEVDEPAAPEAIFIAPEVRNDADVIRVSESVVPPTVQTEIATTSTRVLDPTIGSNDHGRIVNEGASNDWLAMVRVKEDDIDAEMLDIFLDEAQKGFTEIDAALSALGQDLGDRKMFQSLKRSMHTLKGSSNTAGARKIGALFHFLEDCMDAVPGMNSELHVIVQGGVDAAFAGIEALRKGTSVESAVERVGRAAMRAAADFGPDEANPDTSSETSLPSTTGRGTESVPSVTSTEPATTAPSEVSRVRIDPARKSARSTKDEDDSSALRVGATTLDRMVKSVGEIGIARSQISSNIDLSKSALSGLGVSLERMNGYLRSIELEAEKQMTAGHEGSGAQNAKFDALQMDRFTRLQELTRRVAEAQNDVMTQQSAIMGAIRDMQEASATQFVLISNLSGDLDEIRQVRVSSIVPNLKRVVRAACRDTSKQGDIYFDADVEIDRGILDKIVGPIEHILRNAIAHGIESPLDRSKAGKVESGTIEFRAFQDGGEVVIEIRDDGRGIDTQRVLAKAVERNLVKPGARMTEDKVHDLLFEPGFSTAETVTDIAGRGVGLDVVRSQISAMGGRVDVTSTLGQGTTFVLRLPATLTVIAGAAVTTNSHMYVIPVSFIDRLVRISARDLEGAYKSQKLIVRDAAGETVEYDFWGMWQLVDGTGNPRPSPRNSVLLMRGSRTAVHVDDIRPASEFVFRPMGPQVVASSGLIGSTINASGNASLVVDPNRVVRNLKLAASQAGKTIDEIRSPIKKTVKTPLVLIVDDSLTVRKVTSRLLKREGFRHLEAENGMQALERLQEERPDVILMDIEMPVMNGYEATQAIRATAETGDIPIIMITSRVGDSHRERAIELGVNEYLGKPYNDSDLMSLIRKYTEAKLAAANS